MAAALKALEIDPTLAEAYTAMGLIKGHVWGWNGSEAAFKRALELNPDSVRSRQAYSISLRVRRRFDEALEELRKAQALDPLSVLINTNIATTYLVNKEYDAAIEQYQEVLELNSSFEVANQWLAFAYWYKGEHEKAIAQAEKAASLGYIGPQLAVFLRYLLSGTRVEAAKTIENWGSRLQPQMKAGLYAMLGDEDRTLELLNNALDQGFSSVQWANIYPQFDPLRDDPRFQDLLRRMNLAE